MTISPDILDLSPVAPPLYETEPRGRHVPFGELVRAAEMRNVVTLPNLPDIRIHEGPHDFMVPRIGGAVYCVSEAGLPSNSRARSREILRRLAYGFFDYAARETVARFHRDLKRLTAAPSSSAEEEARLARRALSEAALRIKRVLREHESASIGDLAAMTGMAQPNVSRIVAIMTKTGAISVTREGRRVVCRLADSPEISSETASARPHR
jgi:DNA-binding transcriptional ArsR family regulator